MPEISARDEGKQAGPRHWFAVRTQPNREQLARIHYERQGYTVYLPLVRTICSHARKREEVLRPFFPGYLFLHFDPQGCDWVALASTRGAIGPVRFGDKYIPVPDWVIADLRAREDENGAISLAALQKQKLSPGTAVEIQLDSGASAHGLFYSFRGEENVVVLLNFLERQVKATVPLDRLTVR